MTGLDTGDKPNEEKPDSSGENKSDAGALDYSKIDWATFDWSKVPVDTVPETVVKATPTGKALLTETVERRQKIKALQEAIADKPAEKPKDEKPVQSDMPEWARELMTTVSSLKQDTEQGRIDKVVAKAIADHKLPAEAAKFLTGKTEQEITEKAVELAKMFVPKDGTSPGNPGGSAYGDVTTRARAIIADRINGAKPVVDKGASIFGDNLQRIK